MPYRYTNTDKWTDAWFANLKPLEKLLFNYLCDNCDIAGFIEVSYKRWSSDIGADTKAIEGALNGLKRGLIFSRENDCIYLRTFIKHQKNLPLNESNKSHLGIIRRFELYANKFDIQSIEDFITRGLQGAFKGLNSPSGNGIGNGIGKDKEELKIILREKASKFKEQVLAFSSQYPKEMLLEFFQYWIEPNKSYTKMRYEQEKTWELSLRLIRWAKNQKAFKKPEQPTTVMPSKNASYSNYQAKPRRGKEVSLMEIILDKEKQLNSQS